jgi:predicted ATPase
MLVVNVGNRGVSSVLIGRAAETTALSDMLRTVRRGDPATMLVAGEAGVGKTRLIGEYFPNEECRLLTGACFELGADGLPFGPFTAMVRDLVKETGAGEVAAMLPGGGRFVPELARLLPELAGPDPSEGAGRERGADEARGRLFEEFLTLMGRLAEKQPLVVVIEDVHWADRSSRDLLAFLVRYQRSLRGVAIVITFRSDELHRSHPLRPLLAELSRIDWVDRVELPRLSRWQTEQLAAAILGREPGGDLADALYARAEGNPLFIEELLDSSDGSYEVPGSLTDLLLRGVRRLPAETQAVLRVASASSEAVGPQLLAKVTGRSEDELAETLRPAVAGNVLVSTAGGYAFRHALIREAVFEDMLPGEPGRIHGKYALAIEEDPSLVPADRAEIVKAHHWHAANNTTWALVSAWQAARQAGRSVAHADRMTLLARVLELWDQVPGAAARIGVGRAAVFEEVVAAAQDAGEVKRGLALTRAAIAELDEEMDAVRVAGLLLRQAFFKDRLGLPGGPEDIERALSLVPESMACQEETHPEAWRVRMSALLDSVISAYQWSGPRLQKWLDEVLGLARKAGDLETEARALLQLALARANPGGQAKPGSEPMRLIAQGRAVAVRADAHNEILRAGIYESHFLCGVGDYERAVEIARQGVADAERFGIARSSGAFITLNVIEPLFALGRWDEVIDVAERVLDLAPPPRTTVAFWYMMGRIAVARGDYSTAAVMAAACRPVLAGVRYDDQHHPSVGVLETDLKLATEDPAAAVRAAASLLDRFDLAASGPRYLWPFLVSAAFAARAAMQAGDAGVVAGFELLVRLQAVARELEAFGPVQQAWRLMFTAAALCAEALRPAKDDAASPDPMVRLASWDAAAEAWEALGQPEQTAIALVRAAGAALSGTQGAGPLRSGAGRRAAVDRLRRAAPLAEQLGARPLSEEIASLARQGGISVTAGTSSAPSDHADGRAGLTAREHEVLRLVAAGWSNLGLSPGITGSRSFA